MHSSSFEMEAKQQQQQRQRDGGEVLVGIAALVTEGRAPGKLAAKAKGFHDGPHCTLGKEATEHTCDHNDDLCANYENVREKILNLWHKNIPVCVEVFLTCGCKENASACDQDQEESQEESQEGLLLEQWYITISRRRSFDTPFINILQLINAIRSQLYFSQITAWLSPQQPGEGEAKGEDGGGGISGRHLRYRLTLPGETEEGSRFTAGAVRHDFPAADIGGGCAVHVAFLSLPRMPAAPRVSCALCARTTATATMEEGLEKGAALANGTKGCDADGKRSDGLLDDRMYTHCTLKGKHCCEESDEYYDREGRQRSPRNFYKSSFKSDNYDSCRPSTSVCGRSRQNHHTADRSAFYSANPFNYQRQNCFLRSDPCPKGTDTTDTLKPHSLECEEPSPPNKDMVVNPRSCSCRNNSLDKCEGVHSQRCDLRRPVRDKGQLLLDAIERTARKCTNGHCTNSDKSCDVDKCVQRPDGCGSSRDREDVAVHDDDDDGEEASCDKSASDIFNVRRGKSKFSIYRDNVDDDDDDDVVGQRKSPQKTSKKKPKDVSNVHVAVKPVKSTVVQKLTFDGPQHEWCAEKEEEEEVECLGAKVVPRRKLSKESNGIRIEIPTASEQAKFRKNLDSAASMVFHSQTGLPLTSSPAPVRRGKSCFDFDSTINSVSAIKSALYSTSFSTDEESESESSTVSPCSPDSYVVPKRDLSPIKYRRKGHAANLLGSFEESVLNGRLEPVSTVHGFTAELGASGSFVPKHLVCPVTVFFYTLGDNDKVSSPYLGHINLGKKGYNVPKTGTVQVTLFNPLGTVVKMFVIMYDLSDMPPNSQTFIRQRTLYMPTNCKDENLEWGPKWLRFLIHLRFMSSKSGKIYLHSDIRMIIFRKSDMDTATAHGIDMSYELRSFTHMPNNPRFSPRK